jgi:uncharacterized protein
LFEEDERGRSSWHKNKIKEYELDDIVRNRTQQYRIPINIQIHEIDYINKGLEFGQYFFTDIIKEGVLLYDTKKVEFADLLELSPKEEKKISQVYFDIWFRRSQEFLIDAKHAFNRDSYSKAVFELHQATENLYYTILLVFTGYKPKTHKLHKLRKYAKPISEELFFVFPIENDNSEKHLFDLLKAGYIDARYNDDFKITRDELLMLFERFEKLRILVENLSKEKIASIPSV